MSSIESSAAWARSGWSSAAAPRHSVCQPIRRAGMLAATSPPSTDASCALAVSGRPSLRCCQARMTMRSPVPPRGRSARATVSRIHPVSPASWAYPSSIRLSPVIPVGPMTLSSVRDQISRADASGAETDVGPLGCARAAGTRAARLRKSRASVWSYRRGFPPSPDSVRLSRRPYNSTRPWRRRRRREASSSSSPTRDGRRRQWPLSPCEPSRWSGRRHQP
jgi:hypothetical protein